MKTFDKDEAFGDLWALYEGFGDSDFYYEKCQGHTFLKKGKKGFINNPHVFGTSGFRFLVSPGRGF